MSPRELANLCGIGTFVTLFFILSLVGDIKGDTYFELHINWETKKWNVNASWSTFLEPPAVGVAFCIALAILFQLLEHFYRSLTF